MNFDSTKSTI